MQDVRWRIMHKDVIYINIYAVLHLYSQHSHLKLQILINSKNYIYLYIFVGNHLLTLIMPLKYSNDLTGSALVRMSAC